MGVYRLYSNPLWAASRPGHSFTKRHWSFFMGVSLLALAYVTLGTLLTPASSTSSRLSDEDVLSHSELPRSALYRTHAQHMHRTATMLKTQEAQIQTDRTDREKTMEVWQSKVAALTKQLAAMQEKVRKEEALEADVWRLKKELDAVRQRRDPLMPMHPDVASQLSKSTSAASASAGINITRMATLPAASAWCFGNERYDRLCRFKNLCYLPQREAFVLPKHSTTTLRNIPQDRGGALVDLTSLKDHSAFYFDYTEIDATHPQFQNRNVRYVEKPAFLLSRFHPGNIMHTIHDDVLGLYHLLKEFAYHGETIESDPFALDHYIQFLDAHGSGDYAALFQYLTSNPLLYRESLQTDPDTITCYRDAIVGTSKQANWYHYGFSTPQGPIANKTVDGQYVREVADYIMRKAGFDEKDVTVLPPESEHFDPAKVTALLAAARERLPDAPSADASRMDVISIFSRLRNRKLENEGDVAAALRAKHHLPTVYVRMEELTFLEQVAILRRTRLALGMHGSILIMGIFLPRGAALMELYPYAVPSDNYTPYRHMANLPGMDLAYGAWENTHAENTKSYPNNHMMVGGLGHLSAEERQKVMTTPTVPKHLCCTNAYWLYRIFQDTTGHVREILDLSTTLLARSEAMLKASDARMDVEPSAIDATSVMCHFDPIDLHRLTLKWDAPWNGAHVQGYSVWDHNSFQEYLTTEPSLVLHIDPKKVTQVWIRPKKDDWRGKFTSRIKCVPQGVIDNVR